MGSCGGLGCGMVDTCLRVLRDRSKTLPLRYAVSMLRSTSDRGKLLPAKAMRSTSTR